MKRFVDTMTRGCAGLFIRFALVWLATDALAQGVRVETILVNDKAAEQAPEVIVISAAMPQGERRVLKRNEAFVAGFEIVAPAMTVIVFKSENGNRIVLEPGARIRVADVTKSGERYLLRVGTVIFEVVRALSFFNVEFEEKFLALVRGTKFRVNGDEAGRFTCEVLEGEVVVQRPQDVRIGNAPPRTLIGNPLLLTLEGKSKVEWSTADGSEPRSFATLKDADRFFGSKLEQAKSDRLDSIILHAQLLAAGGQTRAALASYTEAQEFAATQGSNPDRRVAELYLSKAGLLSDMNRAQEALHDYSEARKLYNELYMRDASPEVARVLSGEAQVYAKLKRYDVSAEKYIEAIEVESRFSLMEETPRIRRNLQSIAELYRLAPSKLNEIYYRSLRMERELTPSGRVMR